MDGIGADPSGGKRRAVSPQFASFDADGYQLERGLARDGGAAQAHGAVRGMTMDAQGLVGEPLGDYIEFRVERREQAGALIPSVERREKAEL